MLLHKLKDELDPIKAALNEMSLLVHKMAEKQEINLDDAMHYSYNSYYNSVPAYYSYS